ncbi:MAG: MarR family transcriptional regulator [Candidatus Omnitrophica bacterium]|nr:MarR family transcriptional regulator [Candidatus Omnitrophota bacterium]
MEEMPLSEFADRVGSIMSVLMRNFLKQQTDKFYQMKITIPQFAILNFLSTEGEHKMTDMAKFMNVSTAAVTGIIDRLTKSGYVTRKHDPDDRRIVRVKLTDKGIDLVKKSFHQRRQMIIDMFGKISQKEREDYLHILTHIKERLPA